MKFNSVEIGLIALLLLGFLYFYNNPLKVYKEKPVYYPVYQNRYIPINRHNVRPKPYPSRPKRPHRHHIHHDKPHIRKLEPLMPPAIPIK